MSVSRAQLDDGRSQSGDMTPLSSGDATATATGRLRRWRRAQGLGGLMLAVSFFLPAVETCRSPDYPCQLLWECVGDFGNTTIEELLFWPVVLLGPYLFGLLSLLVAVRPIREAGDERGGPGSSIVVLLGVCAVLSLIAIVIGVVKGQGADEDLWVATVFVAVSCVYWIRGVRGAFFGVLGIRWYASLCCILWYSPAWESEGPRCANCGYSLIGLTSNRCPECGGEFGGELVAASVSPTGTRLSECLPPGGMT